MGFHHVALATRDTAATHRFYAEVMGFDLVKVVAAPTPTGGWSKHFFYDTGGNGLMAFWEIHDDTVGNDFPVDINAAAGLPWWVNHIAFDAPTLTDLQGHRDRWRAHGHTVLEVDHEFCISIYIRDPSGNMVEFCHSVRPFTESERARALALITDADPDMDHGDYPATVHKPLLPA
jgi:catechol 2,3-dioxygenase-like lactoylglutathione lyase family enzyme